MDEDAGVVWVCASGVIALVGVAIHVGAILGGHTWYSYFGAPPRIVASARAGTLLAPASAGIIAILMLLCALYAFSSIGLAPQMPVPRLMLSGMAGICSIRALIFPPLAIVHPELRHAFDLIAAITWGVAAIGFGVGSRLCDLRHENLKAREQSQLRQ